MSCTVNGKYLTAEAQDEALCVAADRLRDALQDLQNITDDARIQPLIDAAEALIAKHERPIVFGPEPIQPPVSISSRSDTTDQPTERTTT